MPVAKYALLGSLLRFSNGNTAMLFSEIAASGGTLADLDGGQCQNNHVATTNTPTIKIAAGISTNRGRPVVVDWEIAEPIFFLPRSYVNFSGGSGLPSSSVCKFTT